MSRTKDTKRLTFTFEGQRYEVTSNDANQLELKKALKVFPA